MTGQFEKLGTPRFRCEVSHGQERIEIRPHRRIPILLFLSFWFVGWSCGGVAMLTKLLTHFELFTAAWLGGWAIGWVYVALIIGWLLTGSEILTVVDGHLSITYQILGIRRRRRYRGGDIRRLTMNATHGTSPSGRVSLPSLKAADSGRIKFGYGARTVYAGVDLDEEEARQVVERLAARLPATASS